jgi:hypothetical protein
MALHVLAVLFTYWSVSFNALVNYKTVTALADAEYVQVSGLAAVSCVWVMKGAVLAIGWALTQQSGIPTGTRAKTAAVRYACHPLTGGDQ